MRGRRYFSSIAAQNAQYSGRQLLHIRERWERGELRRQKVLVGFCDAHGSGGRRHGGGMEQATTAMEDIGC